MTASVELERNPEGVLNVTCDGGIAALVRFCIVEKEEASVVQPKCQLPSQLQFVPRTTFSKHQLNSMHFRQRHIVTFGRLIQPFAHTQNLRSAWLVRGPLLERAC